MERLTQFACDSHVRIAVSPFYPFYLAAELLKNF